jgi:HK97 family phage major capsid protein
LGEFLAENTQAATQDVAFGQTTLNAYKFSSKMILVPIELLQDSAFDVEASLLVSLVKELDVLTTNYSQLEQVHLNHKGL